MNANSYGFLFLDHFENDGQLERNMVTTFIPDTIQDLQAYGDMFQNDDGNNSVVKFPFQYMEQFFLGNMNLDDAIENTTKEVDRLIMEYVEKNKV